MKQIYKLKYKPLNLYFKPAKDSHENLGKKGKVYSNKPNFDWCKTIYHNGSIIITTPQDWEIEVYSIEPQLAKIINF